jgi:hypothetical protein
LCGCVGRVEIEDARPEMINPDRCVEMHHGYTHLS